MKSKKNHKITIIVISFLLLALLAIIVSLILLGIIKTNPKPKLNPNGLPIYEKPSKKTVSNADYYVSAKTGDDENDGSFERPFKTVNKARDVIRNLIKENSPKVDKDITVAIMAGEYNFKKELSFNSSDNLPNNHKITYTSYNKDEVVFSGGVSIKASDFKNLDPSDAARLTDDARKNVRVVNLFKKGIDSDTIGKLYAIGGYSQGRKYGEDNGVAAEVFYDEKRANLARYPNKDFSKIGKIVDYGEASEHVPDIINWNNTPSPRPPKFKVDSDMKNRMQKWQKPTNKLNSIWTYGYFYWDWADVSSPVEDFNKSEGQLDLKYSSPYGIKENGTYYVYNVFEELDEVGEYYIDRATGNLYMYFPEGYNKNSNVTISLLKKSIIESDNVSNITIDGITLKCARSNGINISGSNITISNMLIKNVAFDGIKIRGKNNLIIGNEIKNVGKSGIIVGNNLNYKEGDITNDIRKDGLRLENNIVKNNYIHAYGENSKSGIAGVSILGVGNKVMHNEIFDAPYTGILYAGNEHIIEYNYIHDVVKNSADAGAIYSGRNLSYFGNVIRYNAILNIGNEKFKSNGIYFDDCLAGQVAYGNLLSNIAGNGFLIGGGREHKVYDNTIINAKDPIRYDARAYEGLSGGWYSKNVNTPDARQWKLLKDAKTLYENWIKDPESARIMKNSMADYSKITKMVGFDKKEKPESAATPNGLVENNIIVSKNKHLGVISDAVKKYAQVKNNNLYDIEKKEIKESFKDFNIGNYLIKNDSIIAKENKNYNSIPYHLIGRIND